MSSEKSKCDRQSQRRSVISNVSIEIITQMMIRIAIEEIYSSHFSIFQLLQFTSEYLEMYTNKNESILIPIAK